MSDRFHTDAGGLALEENSSHRGVALSACSGSGALVRIQPQAVLATPLASVSMASTSAPVLPNSDRLPQPEDEGSSTIPAPGCDPAPASSLTPSAELSADPDPMDHLAGEDTDGAPDHLSEWQLACVRDLRRKLRLALAAVRQGANQGTAALAAGLSGASLSRTVSLARAMADTLEGRLVWLVDQSTDALLAPGISPGRPAKHALSEQEALCLRGLILARSTQAAMHFQLAVEEFANDPGCSASTRAFILAELDRAARNRRRPVWPITWRRQAYPTTEESAMFRGRKHTQEVEMVTRRGDFWTDEMGNKHRMEPHSIWEMDDWSDNEPRVSIDPDTGERILTRQILSTQDVYSAAVLGFTQVCRERDAYRIEDVADHVAECVRTWGLPDFFRLEMGPIWDGSFFHGVEPDVAGWPEDELWGGLAPIVRLINVHKSKGKGGIEGSFNLKQAMKAHAGLSIGRVRGEFEGSAKALTRSQRTGQIDPGFVAVERSADILQAVCERFNARPKERHNFGRDLVVPDDLLRGARGRDVPADQWWRFCPVKRQATVRGGHVCVTVNNYPREFRFRVNGELDGLQLDHGYQVLIAFHPGRPEEGCHVFNAELGVRNRDGFKRGEHLLLAPLAADVAQIDLSGRADFSPRRRAAAAVVRNFRAIGAARRAAHVQNSDGHVARAETGSAPAAASLPTVPARQARPDPFAPATPEQFSKQAALNARLKAAREKVEMQIN